MVTNIQFSGPDRVDRGHDRAGHHPVHRHLHHLRRLHQEEEEGREEVFCHGKLTIFHFKTCELYYD